MSGGSDFQRVREQVLDTETGTLAWASTEYLATRVIDQVWVVLPQPSQVSGDDLLFPYKTAEDRALDVARGTSFGALVTDEAFHSVQLRKRWMLAGPYLVRVWDKA